MMEAFGDLIMYSKEVYFYYLRAYGETFGVVRGINAVLSAGLFVLFLSPLLFPGKATSLPRSRWICLVLAYLWAWVGLGFHYLYFTPINTAAYGFVAVFLLQAVFFLVAGTVFGKIHFVPANGDSEADRWPWSARIGAGIYLFALIGVPLLSVVRSEPVLCFGWGAEATAAGSLGLLLGTRKNGYAVASLFFPFLYSIWAFLRARKFDLVEETWLAAIVLVTMVCWIVAWFAGGERGRRSSPVRK